MKPALLLALGVAFVAGCAQKGAVAPPEQAAGIPSKAIGLNKVEITQIPDPLLFRFVDSEPGDAPLPERPFYLSPPVITHTLEGMLPITRAVNECIECHEVDEREPGEPTPIPPSHFVDLRNAPDAKQDAVVGSRYNCVSCHVAQSDVLPLVESNF